MLLIIFYKDTENHREYLKNAHEMIKSFTYEVYYTDAYGTKFPPVLERF